ncbi:Response regulator with CheY-like receiver domain and winged-helix DNA-binding domain [Hyella patelloides LEGE 07179]|uniref:Response regulator with CheY-like receiver domain and winged-helix DNA-binding domain n=1 Tax=Hyella patelloides LEGE 07179 TaxID=945734 RepID=A0A563VJ63_9CYAN|nr:response regulator [Hyella patelloides]VEP11484.1 Response regulator with CheY-like receiver domain and winged-helix DNA-binding domain [Hyella patelloides LEGE 07179]
MSNILIAEDESRIASFIEKGLRKNGFNTAVATNGEEALSMIQNNNFDLLLLDLGLPVKDGWTVLNELRNQGNQIPIIVVSAYNNVKKDNGMTHYVAKPFRFKELLKIVQFHLQED